MISMEHRIRALDAVWLGQDEQVDSLARHFGWALQCTPARIEDQERNLQGYQTMIEESGLPSEDVQRALILALARGAEMDENNVRQIVTSIGVDIMLGAMALPSEHVEAFLLAQCQRKLE